MGSIDDKVVLLGGEQISSRLLDKPLLDYRNSCLHCECGSKGEFHLMKFLLIP